MATTIGVYFDGHAGTLTFFKDGKSLGVAFTGLKDKRPLYPIVCSTAAKTEMALGVMRREFLSLQDRCRSVIMGRLSTEEQIDMLCLPKKLKIFISEGCEDFKTDSALSQNNKNGRYNFSHW